MIKLIYDDFWNLGVGHKIREVKTSCVCLTFVVRHRYPCQERFAKIFFMAELSFHYCFELVIQSP